MEGAARLLVGVLVEEEMEPSKTVKQRIIEMLHRLPDAIDFDRAIEGICVLRNVEVALEQIRQGDVFDDDGVMSELSSDDEIPAEVGARSEK